jgi:hypothetical protein
LAGADDEFDDDVFLERFSGHGWGVVWIDVWVVFCCWLGYECDCEWTEEEEEEEKEVMVISEASKNLGTDDNSFANQGGSALR